VRRQRHVDLEGYVELLLNQIVACCI
jgi:hypothetical protein